MIERQRGSLTTPLKHSSLNSVSRAKSSLRLIGENKEKQDVVCFIRACDSVCACTSCFSVLVPVPCQLSVHSVCIHVIPSVHMWKAHSTAVCECNQISISSLYMAELLRWRCPTGKCNYTLLATEYGLHCPICLWRDSGFRPLLTGNIKQQRCHLSLLYLRKFVLNPCSNLLL